MKELNLLEMTTIEGGVWCAGSGEVDFWGGLAAGIGIVLLFTPAFAIGGTILVHSGAALLLNHQCME